MRVKRSTAQEFPKVTQYYSNHPIAHLIISYWNVCRAGRWWVWQQRPLPPIHSASKDRVTRERQASPQDEYSWVSSTANPTHGRSSLLNIRLSWYLCLYLLSACSLVWLSAYRWAVGPCPTTYTRWWGSATIWVHSRWWAAYHCTVFGHFPPDISTDE